MSKTRMKSQLEATDNLFRMSAEKVQNLSSVDRERFLKIAEEIKKTPARDPLKNGPSFVQTSDGKKIATADGFDNFISRIGLNNDNALSGGMYIFNLITRNRLQLEAAYRGSWVVGAVIDAVAEDMTRAGISITTNVGDNDIREIQTEITRLQLWDSICSNTKWARLYGGSLAVIQIKGQSFDSPLDVSTVAKGQFQGLAVYDRWQLNPDLTHIISSGPEIGLPKYYYIVDNLTSTDPQSPTPTGQLKVHHSRVIRQIGIELPYFQAITEMMWGESILERLWDRLIAFDNVTMSAASLVDRANLRMVGIEGLREIIASGGQAVEGLYQMFEMMRLMQVNEGLTLLDKNDSYQTSSYTFAGLPETILQFGQQLSGASGIPLVRLFGQAPAGLSATGDSDIRLYYDNINAQQESRLRSPWDVLLKILWRSVTGKDAPKDLDFNFVPLWQTSELDQATIAKSTTETVIGAYEAGLVTQKTAMQELRQNSGDHGLFTNISDQDINAATEEMPPMPGEVNSGLEGVSTEENPPVPGASGASEKADDPKDPVRNIDTKKKTMSAISWLRKK